jgi:UDP-glucose 4-epimerase
LRFFYVFGPRQRSDSPYAAVIPRFIAALLDGTPVTVYGDGLQTRDFTYVVNVVNAILLAAQTPAVAGQTLNIACGERTSLNSVLEELSRLSGGCCAIDRKPARPGDIRHAWADIDRARTLLGYAPDVRLAEGLRRTFEWTVRQRALNEAAAREERRDEIHG